MLRIKILFLISIILFTSNDSTAQASTSKGKKTPEKVVIGYVTSWTKVIPDPRHLTHINYAFGHVTDDFMGVRINNEDRLKRIVALKKTAPHLKILLSIGGWGSGRFSEMAASKENRKSFAEDCARVSKEFDLDGIDIDWEYPTSAAAGISASPEDTKNFTLLMQDIRKIIGKQKLLTLASVASAKYIDFKAIEPTVDFVNIMSYDMGNPPRHHAGLFRSKISTRSSVDEGVIAHHKAGMPYHKLVLGIPFYGRGKDSVGNFIDYNKLIKLEGYARKWDDESKTPFLENASGEMVCSYEDVRSIAIKCDYLHGKGMRGAMYWDYSGDVDENHLRDAVYNGVFKIAP